MITTWWGVKAIRRPSRRRAASTALPQEIVSRAEVFRFDSAHPARLLESPRWYVEMIMKAKSPEHGLAAGGGEAPGEAEGLGLGLGQGAGVGGTKVMSKVRSRPGGLWLAWERSVYLQVPG